MYFLYVRIGFNLAQVVLHNLYVGMFTWINRIKINCDFQSNYAMQLYFKHRFENQVL